jgi:hypothetical protein
MLRRGIDCLEDEMPLWAAGRRVAVEAFYHDSCTLILHAGKQDELPNDMQFNTGDRVYMVVFHGPHQVMYQYNTLETGWKKNGGSLNILTRELFGCVRNENSLASLGQGREGEK